MGVVLIYAFLRRLSKVPDFHGENLARSHLTFMVAQESEQGSPYSKDKDEWYKA